MSYMLLYQSQMKGKMCMKYIQDGNRLTENMNGMVMQKIYVNPLTQFQRHMQFCFTQQERAVAGSFLAK